MASEPPDEDSDDLTDEEVQAAIETSGQDDMMAKLKAEMEKHGPSTKAYRFERRIRESVQYMRVYLESGSTLMFKVDWIGGTG